MCEAAAANVPAFDDCARRLNNVIIRRHRSTLLSEPPTGAAAQATTGPGWAPSAVFEHPSDILLA